VRAHTSSLLVAFLAVTAPVASVRAQPPADEAAEDTSEIAEEPVGGAAVSPIELVPRVELRQSYLQVGNGVAFHDTTPEIDIQFARRLLLRYQVSHRMMEMPAGQVSGFGDTQLTVLGIVTSTPTKFLALIVGAVLDTATAPPLGAGKQQLVFGAGAAWKPVRWLLPYVLLQEQLSVGGQDARPDVNQLLGDLGVIVFGKQYNWIKLDLVPTVDFPGGATGRLLGTLEVGSLLIGRVGLFVRAGTQLAGRDELDYSLAAGIRYLFRLGKGKPR
jgi:hypothetical protein